MKKATYLHIPQPCHENWDEMTPEKQGRFCQSCAKTVVDFSNMTDQQILEKLKKNAGNTCGRFTNEQLERPMVIESSQYLQPQKLFMAAFIPAFFSTIISTAQTKLTGKVAMHTKHICQTTVKGDTIIRVKPQKEIPHSVSVGLPEIEEKIKYNNHVKKREVSLDAPIVKPGKKVHRKEMKGIVVNSSGEPVPYTTVVINNKMYLSTDEDGSFSFPLKSDEKNVRIQATSVGFESIDSNLYIPHEMNEPIILMLNNNVQLEEVVVGTVSKTKRCSVLMGGISRVQKVSKIDTSKAFLQKLFNKEMFSVFPNPIARGSALKMLFRKKGTYTITLFDNNGKLYAEKNIEINSDKQVYSFEPSLHLSAGIYYIKAFEKNVEKQFVEKIIIQ